ncbi:GSCOCG00000997001-RA-CDS [Cotesia congregata]|nr:GSCOCG00000997001-RA-CDS [Cotesia congregata]
MQLQQHHQQEQLQQQAHQSHHHHHHHYHQHQQYSNQDKRGPETENNDNNIAAVTSRIHQPPALPPRPPPRSNRRCDATPYDRNYPVLQIVRCRLGPEAPMEGTIGYPFTMAPHSHSHLPRTGYNTHLSRNQYRHPCGTDNGEGNCCKKYVVLCCLCGGLSAAVGCLFLAVHAVLSAHTASLALFETVPSYIPGIMLILMGLFTMILARRKHRYGILMKVCGSVGVVCALVCVLVTVTTTVVHMSRLQGLRECVYTARARSCTCYGAPQGRGGDPGVLFEGTPHCEAVHGALYACLRALFGVSVAGILACIFSCMLVYQLLSHEKKKMYWEQLELRCRSLYGHGGGGNMAGAPVGSCGCCNDCGGVNPWWAQTPGNLYTPNPDLAPSRRWRLPWSRSRGPAPTPDSNYGFHAQSMRQAADINDSTRENTTAIPNPYGLLDSRQPHASYSVLNAQNTSYTASTESYSVLETPVPLWGPPPPYSDPNSPARRPQIVEPKVASSAGSTTSSTPATGATLQHCTPSDNYENTEKLSNTTEPECSGAHEGAAIKTRRSRRNLKGVENDGFQKEPNNQMSNSKQSESELYFGDVSSCCGPESSLYEMTVDKELTDEILQQQQQQQQQQQEQQQQQQQSDYMPSRMAKQRLSKRSRLPLPLLPQNQTSSHEDINLDGANERSYSNSDETMTTSGAFLAPDAQYEVIQQGAHYGYYISKENDYRDAPSSYSFYPRDPANSEIPHEYRGIVKDEDNEHISRRTEHQCCTNNVTDINSEWQNVEQQSNSDDGVCPINV